MRTTQQRTNLADVSNPDLNSVFFYWSLTSPLTDSSNSHSETKGELIWEYDSQAVLLQAANSKPRQITSGTMPQEAREELATQTIDNIDPLGTNINASNNKNPKKVIRRETRSPMMAGSGVLIRTKKSCGQNSLSKLLSNKLGREITKKKSVIKFYSDCESDTGAHNVSSGIITDLNK